MGITVSQTGSFRNLEKFLNWAQKEFDFQRELRELGNEGVAALAAATPKDSGLTADSWEFKIDQDPLGITITWYNTNVQDGWFNVAVGLQYGHGTGTGGWVQGVDYINPALQPVFDKIANTIWEKVRSK